jgi:hypothetical protein
MMNVRIFVGYGFVFEGGYLVFEALQWRVVFFEVGGV